MTDIMDISFTGELQKASVVPGDILVLRLNRDPSPETIERIQAYFAKLIKWVEDGRVALLVLGPGERLDILHDKTSHPNHKD